MKSVLLVRFDIFEGHEESFSELILQNAESSLRLEPGCLQFDVCRDAENPGAFILYEVYENADAIAAHIASAHFKDFDAKSAAWISARSVQRLTLG